MTITTIRSRRRLTAVLLSGLLAYLLPALGAGLGAPAYGDDPACAAAGANQTTTRRVLLEFGGSRDGTTDGAAYLDSETDPCTEAGGNDISFDAYPSVAVHISCSEDLVGLEFPGLGTVTEFWVDSVNNGGNTPGSCQTDIPTPPVVGEDRPDVRIEKLNDADEDAVFSDDEVADEVGRAVTFEATVTNTGDLAGVVVLVDEYPAGEPSPTVLEVFPGSGATAATCTGPGGAFAGADLLAPGATVTCTFTIDGYTPASGAALTNTLTVELRDETGTPIAGDDDASTVRTIVPETPAAPPTLVLDPCLVLADGTGGLDSTGTATNSDLVAVEVTFADTTVVSVNGVATGDDVTTVTLQPGANTLVFDNSTVGDVVGMSLGDALVAEAAVTDCDASVAVDKTNDADADGAFSDDENARVARGDVDFAVAVTNDGELGGHVSLTDAYGDTTVVLLGDDAEVDTTCRLEGEPFTAADLLAPDATIVCTFTLEMYSPAAGSSLTNTVVATLTPPERDAVADEDVSTVRTLPDPSVPPPTPRPEAGVEVDKTNDADGDGVFSDRETATAPASDVTFRVVVTNTGVVSGGVRLFDDLADGDTLFLFGLDAAATAGVATDCIGADDLPFGEEDLLAPGTSITCTFLLEGYSPEATAALLNTVRVELVDYLIGDAELGVEVLATDDDDSTVLSQEILDETIDDEPDDDGVAPDDGPDTGSVAVTGATLATPLLAAVVLLALGGLILWDLRRRRPAG